MWTMITAAVVSISLTCLSIITHPCGAESSTIPAEKTGQTPLVIMLGQNAHMIMGIGSSTDGTADPETIANTHGDWDGFAFHDRSTHSIET